MPGGHRRRTVETTEGADTSEMGGVVVLEQVSDTAGQRLADVFPEVHKYSELFATMAV